MIEPQAGIPAQPAKTSAAATGRAARLALEGLQGKLTARGLDVTGTPEQIAEAIVEEIDAMRAQIQIAHEQALKPTVDETYGDDAVRLREAIAKIETDRDAAHKLAEEIATQRDNFIRKLDSVIQERDALLGENGVLRQTVIERVEEITELRQQTDEFYQTNLELRQAVGWEETTEGDLIGYVADLVALHKSDVDTIESLNVQLGAVKDDLARSLRQHGEAVSEVDRLRSDPLAVQLEEVLADRDAKALKVESLEGRLESLSERCWPNEYFWVKWTCKHHFHRQRGAIAGSSWRCCWCGKVEGGTPNNRTTSCNREEIL